MYKPTIPAAPHSNGQRNGAGSVSFSPPPPPPRPTNGGTQSSVHTANANVSSYTSANPSGTSMMQRRTGYHEAPTATTAPSYTGYSQPTASYANPPAANYGYTSDTSYASSTTTAAKNSPPPKKSSKDIAYEHSGLVLAILGPTVYCMLFPYHELDEVTPLATLLALGVFLWCLDSVNLRSTFMFATWVAVLIMTCSTMWTLLMRAEDDESSIMVIFILMQSGVYAFAWSTLACWITLQCKWVLVTDTKSVKTSSATTTARSVEWFLHTVSPVTSAAIATFALGTEALYNPYIFAGCLTICYVLLCTQETSFPKTPQSPTEKTQFIVTPGAAFMHSALLLLAPPSMHVLTFLGRILSRNVTMNEWYDLTLAACVPYLILYALTVLDRTEVLPNPYSNRTLFPVGGGLRGTLIPMVVSFLASAAAQQRYMVALAQQWAYLTVGTSPSATMTSVYWSMATVALLFSSWFGGRKNSSGAPLLGDYHEDVVQLSLALAGMGIGKAMGLPWNFTPLPILAFLGLSLWFSTRLLRYLSIFLFVVHATGMVVFTYRFTGMDHSMSLPMGYSLSLLRFGMLEVFSSVLVGLVTGLAVRSSGGWGYEAMKRLDVTGILFVVYSVLLLCLEVTLMKRPAPTSELVGAENLHVTSFDDEDMLYSHTWALITSGLLLGGALFMRRVKILSSRSSSTVVALAIGKAISVYIDQVAQGDNRSESPTTVFVRALSASLLCAVMFAPRVFLQPVYLKGGSSGSRRARDLPPGTMGTFMLYAVFFLPTALIVAIPSVLFPLARAIFGEYSYQYQTIPVAESIGVTVFLWGVSCLSMLKFYLPDGGGDVYKKLSGLALLMGIGIIFCSPSLGGSRYSGFANPYASVSSVGSQLILRGKSRTGGWGLLSAGLATLLAIAGPLELKERRDPSGRKDRLLLLRSMIFSLMFGGGMSWFIILQNMSETEWVFLLLTALTCMTLSFLGTIASVLGYHVELNNFDEVDQLLRLVVAALFILIPVNGAPQYFMANTPGHPLGNGGWLSTYLSVASITLFAFAVSLRSRQNKSQESKASANLGCLLSWGCAVAVLYGRFGVSGMDSNYDVTTLAGLPAPVIGTLFVSPILLLLEGESSGSRKSVKRLSSAASPPGSSFGLSLPALNSSNFFVPMLAGTTFVFIIASLYVVLLRGSGFLAMFGISALSTESDILKVVTSASADSEDHDIAELARKTIAHSLSLSTSVKLGSSGFWTSDSTLSPLVHLGGIGAVLPSFFLQLSQWWWNHKVSASLVILSLPLNIVPLVFCGGISTLQAAAVLNVIIGSFQASSLRRSEKQLRMQI